MHEIAMMYFCRKLIMYTGILTIRIRTTIMIMIDAKRKVIEGYIE